MQPDIQADRMDSDPALDAEGPCQPAPGAWTTTASTDIVNDRWLHLRPIAASPRTAR